MNKYLAVFIGAASEGEKQEITEDQSRKFMTAWADWAQKHSSAIVDMGSPLAPTKRVDDSGTSNVQNKITAYMIVQAASPEDAAHVFSDHPHISLMSGNAVEVMESMPIPNS